MLELSTEARHLFEDAILFIVTISGPNHITQITGKQNLHGKLCCPGLRLDKMLIHAA